MDDSNLRRGERSDERGLRPRRAQLSGAPRSAAAARLDAAALDAAQPAPAPRHWCECECGGRLRSGRGRCRGRSGGRRGGRARVDRAIDRRRRRSLHRLRRRRLERAVPCDGPLRKRRRWALRGSIPRRRHPHAARRHARRHRAARARAHGPLRDGRRANSLERSPFTRRRAARRRPFRLAVLREPTLRLRVGDGAVARRHQRWGRRTRAEQRRRRCRPSGDAPRERSGRQPRRGAKRERRRGGDGHRSGVLGGDV